MRGVARKVKGSRKNKGVSTISYFIVSIYYDLRGCIASDVFFVVGFVMLTIEGRGICNNYTWLYGIINDKVVLLVNQIAIIIKREGRPHPAYRVTIETGEG